MADEEKKIVEALIRAYHADREGVAAICDENLDRSGQLLGHLRCAVRRKALQQSPEQDTNPLHRIVI